MNINIIYIYIMCMYIAYRYTAQIKKDHNLKHFQKVK